MGAAAVLAGLTTLDTTLFTTGLCVSGAEPCEDGAKVAALPFAEVACTRIGAVGPGAPSAFFTAPAPAPAALLLETVTVRPPLEALRGPVMPAAAVPFVAAVGVLPFADVGVVLVEPARLRLPASFSALDGAPVVAMEIAGREFCDDPCFFSPALGDAALLLGSFTSAFSCGSALFLVASCCAAAGLAGFLSEGAAGTPL